MKTKAEKLAEALRANLLKRKQQDRARESAQKPAAENNTTPKEKK